MLVDNSQSKLLVKVEKEIAELLLTKLEHLDITFDWASMIAKFVLTTLPEGLTDDQVIEIIPKLDDEFYELSEIVNNHMQGYEKVNKPIVLKEVDRLTKEGHFEEAANIMKVYFAKVANKKVAQPIQ